MDTRWYNFVPPGGTILLRRLYFADFSIFSQYWQQMGMYIPADLNGDHIVDTSDLSYMAKYWLWP
jgi:hypothetical protein